MSDELKDGVGLKEHNLKIAPKYFKDWVDGLKTFEIRKNDRDYQVGDVVRLQEWQIKGHFFTGNQIVGVIKYISDYEQKDGYVVFSISRADTEKDRVMQVMAEARDDLKRGLEVCCKTHFEKHMRSSLHKLDQAFAEHKNVQTERLKHDR